MIGNTCDGTENKNDSGDGFKINNSSFVLDSTTSSSCRSVSFGRIEIREYEQILGDNPCVTSGPPVGLGWNYDPKHLVFGVEEYEENKKQFPSRMKSQMLIPHAMREAILEIYWHVPKEDIIAMMKEVKKIQKERRETNTEDENFMSKLYWHLKDHWIC